MQNPNVLPFPEPDSQEVAQYAAAFMETFQAMPGYTEDMARREAITYLVFGNAMRSKFLQETGRVMLSEGRSFSMRQRAHSEKE